MGSTPSHCRRTAPPHIAPTAADARPGQPYSGGQGCCSSSSACSPAPERVRRQPGGAAGAARAAASEAGGWAAGEARQDSGAAVAGPQDPPQAAHAHASRRLRVHGSPERHSEPGGNRGAGGSHPSPTSGATEPARC